MNSQLAEKLVQGNQRPRICRVPPAVRSAGPDAVALCEIAGLTLDDWQTFILLEALGEREDGRWSCFETAIVVSRQNGKSELLVARLLIGLFLLKEREQIYCSYQFDSALVVFRRLVAAIEDTPAFMKRVKRIARHHGGESIETTDGCRVSFRTRTKLGGRGHSCDVLIFDEAHILSSAAHGSLLPMLSARRRAQLWYAATAPDMDVNEDAVVLAAVRERAVKGENAERLAYFEWSANVDGPEALTPEMACDPAVWAEANPALNIRISEEQVERERQAMGPVSFAVERCGAGRWPRGDGLPGILDPETWRACEDPEPVAVDPVTFSFDVSPDRAHTAIAASWHGEDGLPRIDVIEERPGTAGVAERIAELTANHRAQAVITDPAGPAASLLPELERLGVKVTPVTATQHAQGCGMFYDYVEQRLLRYRRTKSLDLAVENAVKRPLGDAGWAWSRKSSSVNIAPLVAATLALWGSQTGGSGYDGPLMELI
jgi:phage terminase large subunit-like protein